MNSPILSLLTGEAARLIAQPAKPAVPDPKWARRNLRNFALFESQAKQARIEAEESRERVLA